MATGAAGLPAGGTTCLPHRRPHSDPGHSLVVVECLRLIHLARIRPAGARHRQRITRRTWPLAAPADARRLRQRAR